MSYPLVRLDECTRIVSGATPSTSKKEYWGGHIRWVTPADLSNLDGPFISETPRTLTEAGLASCAAELLPAYSVLFSSRAPIGHVAINTEPMATNQGFKSFVPLPSHLNAQYLYHWLRANRAYLESQGNGATFKEVSKAVVARIEIPLPPLDEQRRIAAILDQADDLRRKRRDALTYVQKLNHSLFYQMFGDPVSNPKDWSQCSFADLCERLAVGIVVRPASYYVETGIPAIRGLNIKQAGIDLTDCVYISAQTNERLSSSRIWQDDVVIVRSGRPGLAAVVPEKLNGVNSVDVIIATPKKNRARPKFLRDFINSSGGRKIVLSESRGQVQQHFNVGSLSKAAMYAPPLRLQAEYEEKLRLIGQHYECLKQALETAETLFASLQHRAFRGEL